jgi:DNA-binding XRE family transcriptional regulator
MCKEERDQQIADLYASGVPASQLARDFSLSVPSIRSIVRAKGVTAGSRKKQETPDQPKQPRKSLSRVHDKLGEILATYRALELKQTRREAAERLGWTSHKVIAVEHGRHDVTLTDLMDLAAYMKKPIHELLGKL